MRPCASGECEDALEPAVKQGFKLLDESTVSREVRPVGIRQLVSCTGHRRQKVNAIGDLGELGVQRLTLAGLHDQDQSELTQEAGADRPGTMTLKVEPALTSRLLGQACCRQTFLCPRPCGLHTDHPIEPGAGELLVEEGGRHGRPAAVGGTHEQHRGPGDRPSGRLRARHVRGAGSSIRLSLPQGRHGSKSTGSCRPRSSRRA